MNKPSLFPFILSIIHNLFHFFIHTATGMEMRGGGNHPSVWSDTTPTYKETVGVGIRRLEELKAKAKDLLMNPKWHEHKDSFLI